MPQDISIEHAMVCWNDGPPRGDGRVKIICHPQRFEDHSLVNTDGACWCDWEKWTDERRLAEIIGIAWELIINYAVQPMVVHRAFWVIPEYREWAKVRGGVNRYGVWFQPPEGL